MTLEVTMKLGIVILALNVAISSANFKAPNREREKESDYWLELGQQDIDFAVNRKIKDVVAKNIIMFLGDGMGVTVTTAGRIYKGQKKRNAGEEEFLVWEKFPNVGFSKTYNLDKQVPDSAATATAYLCGVKANYYTLGVNGKVAKGDCPNSIRDGFKADSILKWSQDAGKETGVVTNTRITHASPAALYAHSPDRYWECDTLMQQSDNDTTGCKDIALQLVENNPGKNIKVIFGGGRTQMGAALVGEKGGWCSRNDTRNLPKEWLEDKTRNGHTAKYVTNNQEFKKLNPAKDDFMMGLFGASHMPYSYQRDPGPEGTPSLKELTEVAIKRLQRSPGGYFLFVEGGRIDHALHDTKARTTMDELMAFEEAVEAALKLTSTDDTLIIVTADHSHVMTMNGYPDRGNNILGKTYYEHVTDNLPFTTLMFTTGNNTNYTWNGEKVMRNNITNVDTTGHNYISQAAVPVKLGYETHGGEDVGIFAIGPRSHLFHRVHEQSYIAHVMSYAACVGPHQFNCNRIQPKYRYDPLEQPPTKGSACSLELSWGIVLLQILRLILM